MPKIVLEFTESEAQFITAWAKKEQMNTVEYLQNLIIEILEDKNDILVAEERLKNRDITYQTLEDFKTQLAKDEW